MTPLDTTISLDRGLRRIRTGVRCWTTDESLMVGKPGTIENPGHVAVFEPWELDAARACYLRMVAGAP